MKLEGSCESVEKMEKLLTNGFPSRLVKDGSKPYSAFGGPAEQRSARFTRKWQLFPPEEWERKYFPERANVEFYYDALANTAAIRISDAGMALLGQRFTALVLSNGLAHASEDTGEVVEPEPVPASKPA
jgi:hypothetical protein